jgi:AcrR family transcriptional regulator
MDALASAAGIGKPVVYRLFANREAVIVGLITRNAQAIAAEVDAAMLACGDDIECMLRTSAHVYFKHSSRARPSLRLVFSGAGGNAEVDQARYKIWDRAAVRWTVRFHERDVPKREAEALSRFLLAGLARFSDDVANRRVTKTEAERIYVAIAITSLRALTVHP